MTITWRKTKYIWPSLLKKSVFLLCLIFAAETIACSSTATVPREYTNVTPIELSRTDLDEIAKKGFRSEILIWHLPSKAQAKCNSVECEIRFPDKEIPVLDEEGKETKRIKIHSAYALQERDVEGLLHAMNVSKKAHGRKLKATEGGSFLNCDANLCAFSLGTIGEVKIESRDIESDLLQNLISDATQSVPAQSPLKNDQ